MFSMGNERSSAANARSGMWRYGGARVLRAVDVRVLQNVVLFINDRLFTANQDDCIFVVEPPHLVRGHKLAPSLLEVLRERTVPALALA